MKGHMKEVNKEMDGSTMDGAEYRYKNAIDQPARQFWAKNQTVVSETYHFKAVVFADTF